MSEAMHLTPDWSLEPLCCRTCDGTGYVDDTEGYLAQFRPGGTIEYFWDGCGNPTKACRVCSGTGRHVSRARAGLAAPPTYHLDIESGGLADFVEAVSGASLYSYQKAAIEKMEGMYRRGMGFDWPVSPKTTIPTLHQVSGKSRNPLCIVDDIMPDDTPEQRQKVLDWYQKELPAVVGRVMLGSCLIHEDVLRFDTEEKQP